MQSIVDFEPPTANAVLVIMTFIFVILLKIEAEIWALQNLRQDQLDKQEKVFALFKKKDFSRVSSIF